MLHLGATKVRNQVNVLKKVKVEGQWKLCPVVVETDGKLKDRVQVNGSAEVHSEGVYYIEWREDGQRRRQSISNRNLVLEHAHLKAVELDARGAGIAVGANATANTVSPIPPPAAKSNSIAEHPRIEIDSITSAAGLIFRSIES